MKNKRVRYQRLTVSKEKYLMRYLNDIYDAAEYYQLKFVGKAISYYSNNRCIVIRATKHNFMHLCGIKYSRGPKRFFDDALNRSLSVANILIKADGTTFQKLEVVDMLKELMSKNIRITGRGHFLYLCYDSALRTNKKLLALTLINGKQAFIPQSLLNLHYSKSFPIGEKVTKIVSKDLRTSEVSNVL